MTAVLYLQLASQGKIKWLKKWLAGTGSAVVYLILAPFSKVFTSF